MADYKLEFNLPAWNKMIKEIVDSDGVQRMDKVADACNSHISNDGYRVSTEGGKPLTKHGYRATVITAKAAAIIDNAKTDRLVHNLHLAGGQLMAAPATGVYLYAPKVVRSYLIGVLDSDVRVATEVPATRPPKLVTITTAATAGGDNIALSKRWVIIKVYHADEATAGNLAELVFAHMQAAKFIPGNGIRDVVAVGTPARFDDPDDSTPRFQMTLEVLLRAHFQ